MTGRPSSSSLQLLRPQWPVASRVKTLTTCRGGGVSKHPYESLNLGDHVGDDPGNVATNRSLLNNQIPREPLWLQQVHGIVVSTPKARVHEADAIVTNQPNEVLAIMTADCLPVLFANKAGTVVGAAHAGWRGLCNGVLENTVSEIKLLAKSNDAQDIIAWMGPAIGPTAFEVGEDVLQAFSQSQIELPQNAFLPIAHKPGKYLANIYLLARSRLESAGLEHIYGGDYCTVNQADQFFSYRRDGVTGRFASLIWIDNSN
jgi:YfiH family protein